MTTHDRQTLTARRRMAHGLEDVLNGQPWMVDARCHGLPTEEADRMFFSAGPVSGETRRFCGGCPVRAECEQFGVEQGDEYGVWGGLSAKALAGGVAELAVSA